MEDMKILARNIVRLREQRGLTLTGMAECSGIAKSTLSTLESGAGNPTVETLWAIANALGVPFGMLVTGAQSDDTSLAAELEGDGSIVRLIERSSTAPRIEVYSITLRSGHRKESAPHPTGVKEKVTVISGTMLVGESGRPRLVPAGESYTFPADVPHVYGATKEEAKAFVFIEYPRRTDLGCRFVTLLDWPRNANEWDGVLAVLNRLLIDVANGIGTHMVRFRGCHHPQAIARQKLAKYISRSLSSLFRWPLACFVDTDREDPYVLSFSMRVTSAFSGGASVDGDGIFGVAGQLARLAESPHIALSDREIQVINSYADGNSWLLSSLATEVLNQRGVVTLPRQLKSLTERDSISRRGSRDQSFSSRISVDHYDAFELLHPAYARQVVAVAQDLSDFLRSHPDGQPLTHLDVGTGPGIPLLMLHELLPQLHTQAIEPDETAFEYLCMNTQGLAGVFPKRVDFLEYTCESGPVPLIVSIGASHHLNTAFFLQKGMELLAPGGILIVADEFLPEFATPEERQSALIRHHSAYLLSTMAWLNEWCLEEPLHEDVRIYRDFQHAIPLAVFEAEAGLVSQAVERCRELFSSMKRRDFTKQPTHPLGAYARFFWLELQALVAGFDYEVERKTYPRRLLDLAQFTGSRLLRHRRVFATTGNDEFGGGTHVFTFQKIGDSGIGRPNASVS